MKTQVSHPVLAALLATAISALPALASEDRDSSLDIRRSPPPSPQEVARMREWHTLYRERLTPTRRAWSALVEATSEKHPSSLEPQCRRLREALDAISLKGLVPAPDASVDAPLKSHLVLLLDATTSCLRRRYFEMLYRLGEAERVFQDLAWQLRRYGLPP